MNITMGRLKSKAGYRKEKRTDTAAMLAFAVNCRISYEVGKPRRETEVEAASLAKRPKRYL